MKYYIALWVGGVSGAFIFYKWVIPFFQSYGYGNP